jgi:hypothetical protein
MARGAHGDAIRRNGLKIESALDRWWRLFRQ